ncbi:TetR/AcrR family transcriptional regulator [Bombilactobacillus bombi]|uniref:TetR/AcrR family transcriptional regulator n=1 Tax=Bombilactobacillus bombi TaxID=1303590 RepID=A0A417ZG04_9LACO|nr:TetR/AcrR family transcriptional regulator [Bombilactobacillus bombi]RHW50229.1 TetR/AcrR family transcriptional regulator [Bombilactobacillus bombi]
MGRKISYNRQQVLSAMAQIFVKLGYEGTSLDDLVKASGLLRGSLYSAFGSKRGMFIEALKDCLMQKTNSTLKLDLILVGLLELAPKDVTVRHLIAGWCQNLPQSEVTNLLGQRLLHRAGIKS